MLCQKCGMNEATVHMVQVINGKKAEQHLCSECANMQEKSWFDTGVNINKMLSGFFEPIHRQESVKCKGCGVSFDEYLKTGLLGCSDCYTAFENLLAGPLKRLQGGAVRHRGKKLGSASNEKQEEKAPSLKEQLKSAIETENYELAAELRDRIREQEGN